MSRRRRRGRDRSVRDRRGCSHRRWTDRVMAERWATQHKARVLRCPVCGYWKPV